MTIPRRTLGLVGGIVAALVATAAVLVVARERAEAPARCAPGMVALGARCCGEGQQLADGRCAGAPRRCAAGLIASAAGCTAPARIARIAGGTLRLGPGDWEAQGVATAREASVAPFSLDAYEVTEARWAECARAGACPARGREEPGRPVAAVTHDEAARFCAWAGGSLPTADQLAFAAAGASGRRYAWGETGAVCRRAAFGLREGPCGEGAAGPEIAGSHPDGASPEGVFDLGGNVAEWTLAPEGAEVTEVRGGSWADAAAAALRSWARREVRLEARDGAIGLRCAYR